MKSDLLDERLLRRLAGDAAYERGCRYLAEGRVKHLKHEAGEARARVTGTRSYTVRLTEKRGALDFDCDCPVGDRGRFCKHAVAMALSLIPTPSHTGEDKPAPSAGAVPVGRRQTGKKRQPTPDIDTYKKTIRQTLATGGFIDYYRMPYYTQKVFLLVEQLSDLLQAGHSDAVRQLGDYALRRGFKALEYVDDSDGELGALIQEIADLHRQSCEMSSVSAKQLARACYELQRRDGWDFIRLEDYAPLLGETGLAHYRMLAEKDWAKAPACGPDDDPLDPAYLNIMHIMERLAEYVRDPEMLIAIKSRDLSHSFAFIQIAELCKTAGREEEALTWARRGYKHFGDEYNPGLTDLLIKLLHHAEQYSEALDIAWRQFRHHPTMTEYSTLLSCADKAGEQSHWREQAITHLTQLANSRTDDQIAFGWNVYAPSLLVDIYLSEEDIDCALETANQFGCGERQWRELAGEIETERPLEAIDIYKKLVRHTVGLGNNKAYSEAMLLVNHIHKLMQAAQQPQAFDPYIQTLRQEFGRKRNFMKLLDES